jgi:hypothetical protein
MHELRAVEVGLVVRAGQPEQDCDERDGDRDRVDQRMAGGDAGDAVGDEEGGERQKSGAVCR